MDANTQAAAGAPEGAAAGEERPGKAKARSSVDYRPFRADMAKAIIATYESHVRNVDHKTLVKESVAAFKAAATCDIEELNLRYLAQDTMTRLREKGDLSNKGGAGAAFKLPENQARRAMDILLNGNGKAGIEFIGYTSLAHALEESAELRKIQEDSGVHVKTLWRRIKCIYRKVYGKDLKRISIHFRPKLTKDVKKERLRKAKKWKKWSRDDFYRIVWIDEKQEYLKGYGTYRCYAPAGMKSFQCASNSPLGKSPKLKYEAAVCAWAGPLYFKAITGTTGLALGYRVRTAPAGADLNPAFCCPCTPCCVQNVHLLAAICLRNAQDAVSSVCCFGADLHVRLPLLLVVLLLAEEVMGSIPVNKQARLGRTWQCTGLALK